MVLMLVAGRVLLGVALSWWRLVVSSFATLAPGCRGGARVTGVLRERHRRSHDQSGK